MRDLGTLLRALRDELGLSLLLVEHHMQLVMDIADYVVVLDSGRNLLSGRPDEIRDDPPPRRGVPGEPAMTEPLLRMSGVRAYYDGVEALHGIDITVDTGEVVVVLGANGAGKTTTLRSICQLTTTTGEIRFDGDLISGASTSSIVRRGIAMVPQGRGTLGDLSVEDNLLARRRNPA
ncbi:ATP-binding cassette domain-containing protein [Nonomuraea ferruginea]